MPMTTMMTMMAMLPMMTMMTMMTMCPLQAYIECTFYLLSPSVRNIGYLQFSILYGPALCVWPRIRRFHMCEVQCLRFFSKSWLDGLACASLRGSSRVIDSEDWSIEAGSSTLIQPASWLEFEVPVAMDRHRTNLDRHRTNLATRDDIMTVIKYRHFHYIVST